MFLIFDTETTGLPKNYKAPYTDTDNWPRMVQLAWQLHDEEGKLIEVKDYIVKPVGFDIPFNATKIHGISTQKALEEGYDLKFVLEKFEKDLERAHYNVGHNIGFDVNIVGCEAVREEFKTAMHDKIVLDTCTEVTANYCKIPGGRGGKFKLPTLTELHHFLFNESFNEAHNAAFDVEATSRSFLELMRRGLFTAAKLNVTPGFFEKFKEANPEQIKAIGLAVEEKAIRSDKIKTVKSDGVSSDELKDLKFAHLHNHSQYSILQSTTKVEDLVDIVVQDGAPGVAITDLGNLMAAFHFNQKVLNIPENKAVLEHNTSVEKGKIDEPLKDFPFKGIIGCELFVTDDHKDRTRKNNGSQMVFLAKNKTGYHNLAKLSSIGHIDGFYYVPRVDKALIEEYKEGLIVLSGGIMGEISSLILNVGETQAENALQWWKDTFGEDFYLELSKHGLEEEDHSNSVLINFAKKHEVKLVAANNTFYASKADADAHDILLCVKEGEYQSTPKGRGRGFRYGFPNEEFYLKPQDQMKSLFSDVPQALSNIQEILDKVEMYQLKRDVVLPAFDIPEQFLDTKDNEDGGKRGENAYLRHLTYEGAKKRYDEITDNIKERLDFELGTIARTGYPGYFLIVQDFCEAARQMGVSVGPGRGSAAGSAVAYCTYITNIDPIKYDLLFERFLNPERVSLPDIDIDFDDEGRERVIQYVIDKYGASQVAQIITYGTMAAKSSIKDCGRVLELPLGETEKIAKLVPDMMKLNKLFKMDDKTMGEKVKGDQIAPAKELIALADNKNLEGTIVRQALKLEGSVRNTGIHACGVIITPRDIRGLVPVSTAKDSDMWCTQFDNSVVEDAGLLKMDFLGLKTLTIIKEACSLVKQRHNVDLDPDSFPLDDEETYALFQRGETIGVFQYESPGMQKHLKDLKPTVFADLIAMNALYRPGPMEYIPSFVRRKHGDEDIDYDLEDMKEYLEETYGITVYQEQVMLLSQKLAGFSKGEADVLRKAMGKKQKAVLDKMKPKFIEQASEKGHDAKVLEKVWKDWEAFASYAFNKSHSTCYAWVAYQTAYLKAHFPAEYMASVLSNNLNDIKSVTFFMEECRRSGIKVLGPDVNESAYRFTVNPNGEIRFGMGGMKGVGEAAVMAIKSEREKAGDYKGLFNMLQRIDLRTVNKRTLESLAKGGAFDSFENEHRAVYFDKNGDDRTFLEKAMKFANSVKEAEESSQVSLFGEASDVQIPEPPIPQVEEWPRIIALKAEKEVNGMYLSSHPLDEYKLELKNYTNAGLEIFQDLEQVSGKKFMVAVIVSDIRSGVSKRGDEFGFISFEDYKDTYELGLFGEDYHKFKHLLQKDMMLHLTGVVKTTRRKMSDDSEKVYHRVNLHRVMLLSEVLEQMAGGVELRLRLEDLTVDTINELEDILTNHGGNKTIKLTITDSHEDRPLSLEMNTYHYKVALTHDLIERLRTVTPYDIKLN